MAVAFHGVALGFQRQHLLHNSTYATISEMAAAEKINHSYISRLMRLAYLSPTIVESIFDGRHRAHLTMKDLMEPFPLDWAAQERNFLASRPSAGVLAPATPRRAHLPRTPERCRLT